MALSSKNETSSFTLVEDILNLAKRYHIPEDDFVLLKIELEEIRINLGHLQKKNNAPHHILVLKKKIESNINICTIIFETIEEIRKIEEIKAIEAIKEFSNLLRFFTELVQVEEGKKMEQEKEDLALTLIIQEEEDRRSVQEEEDRKIAEKLQAEINVV